MPTTPPRAASVRPARPLLAAAVVVHDAAADRVLLLRRGPGAAFGAGLWDLPVGKCDAGEPVTAAAVRELREETGVVVDPAALRLAHVVHGARAAAGADGFLTVVFTAASWQGEPVNREPGKHDRVGWVPLDALPDGMVLSTERMLAACLDGARPGVSLHGWE